MSKQITISISDSLYERLQDVKEEINVSRECQAAIESVVNYQEIQRKEPKTMEMLIERLKAEKKEYDEQFLTMGKNDGFLSAKEMSYSTLLEVTDPIFQADYYRSEIWESGLRDEVEAVESQHDEEGFDMDSYMDGWIQGVNDFWEGIKDKLK